MTDRMVLAIEAAVGGGSVSLMRDGDEIASWAGAETVARGEQLLPEIDRLIAANNIDIHDLDLIAVSAGPGSFTGIRVGIATGLGLSRALDVPLSTVSLMRAMADVTRGSTSLITAVPMGRGHVCIQRFSLRDAIVEPIEEPNSIPREMLGEISQADVTTIFVVHASLLGALDQRATVVDAGNSLATVIAKYSLSQSVESTSPIFISKN